MLHFEAVFICPIGHSPFGNIAILHQWEIPHRLRITHLEDRKLIINESYFIYVGADDPKAFMTFPALTLWRLHCESIRSAVSVQSPQSLCGVSIGRGFAMLCDSTRTLRKLYGDCAETALRITRSRSRQSVRAVFASS